MHITTPEYQTAIYQAKSSQAKKCIYKPGNVQKLKTCNVE